MSLTIRSFIAIELPKVISTHLRNLQDNLKSGDFKVKWVHPEQIHLTLKFLGNIYETDVDRLKEALTGNVKKYAPISLFAKGMGVFPNISRPRVIWVGIGGQLSALTALQKTVDNVLAAIGFHPEKRSFKAHLTIGRVKGSIDPFKLADAIQVFTDFQSETFVADKVFLFKSDLNPAGSVYTKLVTFLLNT